MAIRSATLADHTAISNLLTQLGYPGTEDFLPENLEKMLRQSSSQVLVYEDEGAVAGFIAIDFLTQLVVKGDFIRISCFSVDESTRGKGIGKSLEDYITELAKECNADRIEVHCHTRRTDAHRFYYRQGYTESPKYLTKSLVDKI
ncbi:GNAT family N-acetyltransferase [Mucilaginibacter rubeus]|uniref:GNAT family N-acetyltransferase n=1 Tax=Mucilaginibacter rubeus TaxID=2027860 RepID=A0AAE6MGW6_9SPHI|nr:MULTISPECIES: GNAT family N-acetyltransferase [Mucilaginibacter]QEM02868.1 GNAT family N-acetyltransferase [Mucilaginibacter rubeus]QEM15487.1 GNAT family N-acetyltransferase [Mucilaginibacter gossypii]QTE41781.1 GNAT family N-acetyltransferase [Mucilaginibacter rubeus]QTE48385.1 GNAT family N-acetyltransferase [Mucilaginibacter rubeus]QTE59772.1 GNAT family N-acetyltransferase [Mucilaginibacter rubeus]